MSRVLFTCSIVTVQEALAGMSVDIVEQLANGIKILNDPSIDLEDKVSLIPFFHGP